MSTSVEGPTFTGSGLTLDWVERAVATAASRHRSATLLRHETKTEDSNPHSRPRRAKFRREGGGGRKE